MCFICHNRDLQIVKTNNMFKNIKIYVMKLFNR